jgi:hypothetical protein
MLQGVAQSVLIVLLDFFTTGGPEIRLASGEATAVNQTVVFFTPSKQGILP